MDLRSLKPNLVSLPHRHSSEDESRGAPTKNIPLCRLYMLPAGSERRPHSLFPPFNADKLTYVLIRQFLSANSFPISRLRCFTPELIKQGIEDRIPELLGID